MDRPAAYMPTRAPSPASAQALNATATATATATAEAAILHYYSLFVELPAQFTQCYVANFPFRDAVHACEIALVVPREGAPPTLVQISPGPPQYYAPQPHISMPTPALTPVHTPVPAPRRHEPAAQQTAAPAVIPAVQHLSYSAAPGQAVAHRHPSTPSIISAGVDYDASARRTATSVAATKWSAAGPKSQVT
jgi:hypothetical protein